MLKDQVFAQLKVAMKEKDVLSKGVLQLVKAALDAAEKEKGATLTEAEEIAVINREVKQTNQALEGAASAGRADLIEKEQAKLTLLKSFLPKQLSEEEISQAIAQIIQEENAMDIKQMGKIIGLANQKLAGKAEGKAIANEVKKQLNH